MNDRAELKDLLDDVARGSKDAASALRTYAERHRVGEVYSVPRAAEYCGLAVGTLYNLSSKHLGPCAHKHGRKTVYYPVDLDIFLHSRVRRRPGDAHPTTHLQKGPHHAQTE